MKFLVRSKVIVFLLISLLPSSAIGGEPISIWPDKAPGETTIKLGTRQPFRPQENPPVVRVTDITCPTMTFHPAPNPNGTAVLVLPGGGFGKVVTNKEGTELADILNQSGFSVFVLSYRTKSKQDKNGWRKPLQDAQRAMAYIRAKSAKWKLDSNKIGIVGFSAGGNVATRLLCDRGVKAYQSIDSIDKSSHRPDFAMLIYPWNIYDSNKDKLVDGLVVPENCPPTFLVHTSDDRSTSLGPVKVYASLKRLNIPAELHIYSKGGHGYGTRSIKGTNIGSWSDLSVRWLKTTLPSKDISTSGN